MPAPVQFGYREQGLYVPDAEPIKFGQNVGFGMTPQNQVSVAGQMDITANTSHSVAPQLLYNGITGQWLSGIDVANNGGGADFVVAARNNGIHGVEDVFYIAYNGGYGNPPTIGFGVTPPNAGTYRTQFAASDSLNTMGTASFRVGPSQTAAAVDIIDSNGNVNIRFDKDFTLTGETANRNFAGGIPIKAASFTDGTYNRCLQLFTNGLTVAYGFAFNSTTCYFRCFTNAVTHIQFNTDGSINLPNNVIFSTSPRIPGGATAILTTTANVTSGAGSSTGTLTNAPSAGNPTKWIPISDNGTTRYIPAW